jgi:hypothetical protein
MACHFQCISQTSTCFMPYSVQLDSAILLGQFLTLEQTKL